MAWLERYRTPVIIALLLIIVAGLGVLLSRRVGGKGPIEIVLASPTPPPPIVVYISGAVQRSGVYTLAPNARAGDLIVAAGGLADNADLIRTNLAAPLSDGQHFHVPAVGETVASGSSSTSPTNRPPSSASLINLNGASAAELEALGGIGPVRAQAIIDYRQRHGDFKAVDDLLKVSGIGPATLERIRNWVSVE